MTHRTMQVLQTLNFYVSSQTSSWTTE